MWYVICFGPFARYQTEVFRLLDRKMSTTYRLLKMERILKIRNRHNAHCTIVNTPNLYIKKKRLPLSKITSQRYIISYYKQRTTYVSMKKRHIYSTADKCRHLKNHALCDKSMKLSTYAYQVN